LYMSTGSLRSGSVTASWYLNTAIVDFKQALVCVLDTIVSDEH
jgi:hypothetical protein